MDSAVGQQLYFDIMNVTLLFEPCQCPSTGGTMKLVIRERGHGELSSASRRKSHTGPVEKI
jgi:hypothetical protein